VAELLNTVVKRAGAVDISFKAIGPGSAPDRLPLTELAGEAFARPIAFYTSSNFITATAAARHMSGQGSGVIVTLTAVLGRMPARLIGGAAPAWAAVEAFSRSLALEVGPAGIRVVCLRCGGPGRRCHPRPIPGNPRTGHAAQAASHPRRSRRRRRLHRLRPRRCHDRNRRQPQRRQYHRVIRAGAAYLRPGDAPWREEKRRSKPDRDTIYETRPQQGDPGLHRASFLTP
jgi:NAD(P)-dependent dehydrogenase (short-subunit alcohol dehydrogenase family)